MSPLEPNKPVGHSGAQDIHIEDWKEKIEELESDPQVLVLDTLAKQKE